MKRFAVFALAMLVALFPVIANAEEGEEAVSEEVWSAAVLRVDPGSLLVRIEAVDPENEDGYPWDEEESPEESPAPQPTETPRAHSLAAEDGAENDEALGVQVVRFDGDTPVWRRADGGFEAAGAEEIAEGDLLTLRVREDGMALGIVIEESDPAAGTQKS